MNQYTVSLLILIAGYNLVMIVYALREGWKSLSIKKKNIPEFKLTIPKVYKYSIHYNTATELYSIFDGHRWIDEIEINNLNITILNKRAKTKDNSSYGFILSPEDAKKRFEIYENIKNEK